jgi:hypothetical protein
MANVTGGASILKGRGEHKSDDHRNQQARTPQPSFKGQRGGDAETDAVARPRLCMPKLKPCGPLLSETRARYSLHPPFIPANELPKSWQILHLAGN